MFKPSPFGWVSQYFGGFFFAYGVYLPFWGLWFSDQGVSASDIGLLIGIGFATRCLTNLVLTPRLHKVEHLMPALRLCTFAALLFAIAYFFTGGNFWLLALVTIGFNACFGPGIPLSDAMANHYSKLKLLDYGRSRLWGSVSFIVASTLVGYLVDGFGSSMIVYTVIGGLFATLILSLRSPSVLPVSSADLHQKARPKLWAILKQPHVIKFLFLIALIQGSHAAYYSFSAIYWKQLGISESVVGYLWSISVVSEVLMFAFSGRLFAHWSLRAMFLLSATGVIVRWSGLAISTDVLPLVIFQLLHGVTFAVAHFATIRYIQQVDDNQMVALQALYNAIPMGGFVAVMTALSGWGFQLWDGGIFWVMAAMGVLALFVKLDEPKSVVAAQIPVK
ncbi:3-phenylpropionate MFS transporter [Vibrio sp. S17_S38]|uniref:3-phenylpropionate MFS transporter n=1 Tax=Vibrio sp. S17_S38 TaxID=2720229 RepID=UPI0016813E46|nr:3-phenylpropionate MFS transporter [Vibrio sp. S17_S38]MBD1574547.1 3-phenylpropionate MFS transporter [Vibrio sp. S17_S38]